MRQQHDARFFLYQVIQRGLEADDAGMVGDPSALHGHIEVGPEQNRFLGDIYIFQPQEFHDAISLATSSMRQENAHSLSYQLATRQRRLPVTNVPVKSAVLLAVVWV